MKHDPVLTVHEITMCSARATLSMKHDGTDPTFVTALSREVEQAVLSKLAGKSEPVAFGMRDKSGKVIDCITPVEHALYPGSYTIPLYTTPQLPQLLKAAEKAQAALKHVIYRGLMFDYNDQETQLHNDAIEALDRAIEANRGLGSQEQSKPVQQDF